MHLGKRVDQFSNSGKSLCCKRGAHEHANFFGLWQPQLAARLELVERSEMVRVQGEPGRFARISKVLLNLVAGLIRVTHDEFSPTALTLQDHRVPPLQLERAQERDERPDRVRLAPISTVIKVYFPYCRRQPGKIPSKRPIRQ